MGTLSLASVITGLSRQSNDWLLDAAPAQEARPGRLLCDTSLLGKGEMSPSFAYRPDLRESALVGRAEGDRFSQKKSERKRALAGLAGFQSHNVSFNTNPRFDPPHGSAAA